MSQYTLISIAKKKIKKLREKRKRKIIKVEASKIREKE